ncbi:hypothetical protein V1514DRAFT_318202 [Lipomyces japonicus]|uniref:uncharacterized protein n=1 Tax=Lipomyces japonicus TaxID=56871 RepID=UPI0034CE0E2A
MFTVTVTAVTPKAYAGETVLGSSTTCPFSGSPWVPHDLFGIPYDKKQIIKCSETTTSTLDPSLTPGLNTAVLNNNQSPVSGCLKSELFVDEALEHHPFCTPNNTTKVVNEITHVKLQGLVNNNNNSTIFEIENITNSYGFHSLTIKESYATISGDYYFVLSIIPIVSHITIVSQLAKPGPVLRVIRSKNDTTYPITRLSSKNVTIKSHDLSRSAKIAIGVMVAISVLFILGVLICMIIYRNRGSDFKGAFSSVIVDMESGHQRQKEY